MIYRLILLQFYICRCAQVLCIISKFIFQDELRSVTQIQLSKIKEQQKIDFDKYNSDNQELMLRELEKMSQVCRFIITVKSRVLDPVLFLSIWE